MGVTPHCLTLGYRSTLASRVGLESRPAFLPSKSIPAKTQITITATPITKSKLLLIHVGSMFILNAGKPL